jgi:hypothetical protein
MPALLAVGRRGQAQRFAAPVRPQHGGGPHRDQHHVQPRGRARVPHPAPHPGTRTDRNLNPGVQCLRLDPNPWCAWQS